MSGWIGVDLDGTVAEYDKFIAPEHIGEPIPKMVERIKRWIAEGKQVRIFTARAFPIGFDIAYLISIGEFKSYEDAAIRLDEAKRSVKAIESWCLEHIGQTLPVCCYKTFKTWSIWDDRAVQVCPNSGQSVGQLLSLEA